MTDICDSNISLTLRDDMTSKYLDFYVSRPTECRIPKILRTKQSLKFEKYPKIKLYRKVSTKLSPRPSNR